MKQKMYLSGIVVFTTLFLISCTSEISEPFAEQTLEERVNGAKIFAGVIPFTQDNSSVKVPLGSFLYIPTPTKEGYLQIEIKSEDEKMEILNLVNERFLKEFEVAEIIKNTNENGRTNEVRCEAWQPLSLSDANGNGGVGRWCGVFIFGIIIDTFYQSCECGYCCD